MTREHALHDRHSSVAARPGVLLMALWLLLTLAFAGDARAAAADALRASDILPEIEAALMDRGMPADAEIELSNPDQIIAADAADGFQHVSFNAASGRFVMRREGSEPIIGRVVQRVAMPVLARNVERGEIIAEVDLDYRETADAGAIRFVADAHDIVGKEARRPLRAGAPVREADLAEPLLVRKGAVVTVMFEKDGMRLSQQGVAQANGAAGDLIAVRNVKSDRLIKGVVDSVNLVRILSATS